MNSITSFLNSLNYCKEPQEVAKPLLAIAAVTTAAAGGYFLYKKLSSAPKPSNGPNLSMFDRLNHRFPQRVLSLQFKSSNRESLSPQHQPEVPSAEPDLSSAPSLSPPPEESAPEVLSPISASTSGSLSPPPPIRVSHSRTTEPLSERTQRSSFTHAQRGWTPSSPTYQFSVGVPGGCSYLDLED